MSGGSDVVHIQGGSDKSFTDVTKDGHQQTESSYRQAVFPVRIQFPQDGSPVQLENIPSSKVIIQNPIGNDPIYVGSIGAQTPYKDQTYPGDYRAIIIYEGMVWPFQVDNANLLQVVGTPLQSFSYMAYPNIKTEVTTADETPPNPDTAGPVVVSTDPVDTAVNVAIDKVITITMNERIMASSVNNANITISPALPGGGTYEVYLDPLDDEKIKFDALVNFADNTLYTITLPAGGVKDLSGNGIAVFDFAFTTIDIDTAPPTVVLPVDPAGGATNVARDKTITITMSEAIEPGSVTNTTVTLTPSVARNTFVNGSNPNQIIIDPTSDLAASTAYTIQLIAGGVKDLAGNGIAALFSSGFTTAAAAPPPDTTPPTITLRSPAISATGVDRTANVEVTFSEALNPASVHVGGASTSFELFDPNSTKVPAVISLTSGNTKAILNPSSNLLYNTVYTVFVRTDIEDVAGNNLVSTSSWSFTVEAPLTITNRTPGVGATNISIGTTIVIDFDEVLNTSTVTSTSIQVFDTSTEPDTAKAYSKAYSNGNRRITLSFSSALKYSTDYQVFVRVAVKDVNGDDVGTTDVSWIFTTQSEPQVLLYNLAGNGTWKNFGDGSESGRGLQITSTNTTRTNALYHTRPRKGTVKIRRVGSSGWGSLDDTMYMRIRSSGGTIRETIGTFTDARNITTSSSGDSITFENTGQNYQLVNGDCILVEYDDGDSSHYFEINNVGSDATEDSVEVFFDGAIHVGSSGRDMGATIYGQDA